MVRGSILVIDDDEEYTQVLKELLRFEGYKVSIVNSIESLPKDSLLPQIILLDYWFKSSNCELFIKKLRKHTLWGKVPIILVSSDPECEMLSLKNRLDGFIQKPYEMTRLEELIDQKISAYTQTHEQNV